MDEYYSTEQAKDKLEATRAMQLSGRHAQYQAANIVKVKGWEEKVEVKVFENPKTWRLVYRGEKEEEQSEVDIFVQGIVIKKDLPPLRAGLRANPKYLKQCVKITGLGSSLFETDVDAVLEVFALFKRSIENIEDLELGKACEDFSLEMSSRYLTVLQRHGDEDAVKIGKDIDPNGVLNKITSKNPEYVYTDDNVVHYRERSTENGVEGTERMNPEKIRVGDVVDIGFTMIAYPVSGGQTKAILVLRSITLMDASVSQDALKIKIKATNKGKRAKNGLKRSSRFDEEDIERANKKMKRMSLEEDKGTSE